MKNIILAVIAFVPLSSAFAQDNEVTFNSKITEVTVYLEGARVTRTGSISMPAGTHQLVFRQLPDEIQTNSLEITSSDDVKIVSVTPRVCRLDDPKANEKLHVWKDSLELLKLLKSQLINQREVLEAEQTLILSNNKVGGQNGTRVEDVEDMMELFRNRLPQIKKDLLDLRLRENVLNDKINRYQAQVYQYESSGLASSKDVLVIVQNSKSGLFNLTLNYNVQQAYWVPIYDFRTPDVSSKPQLAYKAKVWQVTGEEWKDVKLSLATSNPSQGGNLPLLNAQHLSFADYNTYAWGYGRASNGYYAGETKQQQIAEQQADSMGTLYYTPPVIQNDADDNYNAFWGNVDLKSGSYTVKMRDKAVASANLASPVNTVFAIEGKTTIPSTFAESKNLDIAYFELPAVYSYHAVPKLENSSFVVARISGFEDLFLLPGNMSVFFGGAYVGESYLNPYSTEDTLDIALGRDKRIPVQREKLKEKSGKSFLGSKKTVNYTYEITVKNNRQEAVNMLLKDQIPVSNDKSIEVELKENSGGVLNKDTGILEWNLALAPGETQKVTLSYQVTYPKSKIINGL